MYTDNFSQQVLIEPIRKGADRLCIVSGYATPSMATWHIQTLHEFHIKPIKIDLIVGMCPADGLSLISHKGFQDIIETFNYIPNFSQFNCQYVYQGAPVHTKLYIWLKNEAPFLSFTGSANYTQTAFSKRQRESLVECDPNIAFNYFSQLDKDTIFCNHNEVEEYIKVTRKPASRFEIETPEILTTSGSTVTLSLLSRSGEVGIHSGLNWGQRDRREPNQAYIHLPASISRSGFFPLNKQHFTVLTDDGKSIVLRVQQQGDKAITTPGNNSRIGEYFRNRISVANGAPVWKSDLMRYGRADVTFFKFDDEQFYMDFSVDK